MYDSLRKCCCLLGYCCFHFNLSVDIEQGFLLCDRKLLASCIWIIWNKDAMHLISTTQMSESSICSAIGLACLGHLMELEVTIWCFQLYSWYTYILLQGNHLNLNLIIIIYTNVFIFSVWATISLLIKNVWKACYNVIYHLLWGFSDLQTQTVLWLVIFYRVHIFNWMK